MPIFQFEPPTSLPDFILYIWHSIGKESPSIPDMKFFLSFRAKLMPPSRAQEIIDKALHDGLLLNKNNILVLPETLQTRQAEQEQGDKERIRLNLMQQTRKEKAQTTKTFNDYFREILPEEYKNKTFIIKAKDIMLEMHEPATQFIRGVISTEGEKPTEVVIDGKSSTVTHACEFLTPQYKNALKVCPHIGAIFRSLYKEHPDLANNLIRSMTEKKGKWRFT